jgi:DNA topoisomerase-1
VNSESVGGASDDLAQVALGGSRIDLRPGFHRGDDRTGNWLDDRGAVVSDKDVLGRLRKLAIPPAWVRVWAALDDVERVQATGVDARGRTQYRYAAAATAFASNQKFDHMLAFAEALPLLRRRVAKDIRYAPMPGGSVSATRAIAAMVRLLDRGLFRVGNERYARDNHTYGLTTIRRDQLTVDGNNVTFDFIGKEHIEHRITIDDHDAAQVVHALLERPGAQNDELFIAGAAGGVHPIHSTEVNAYLHTHTAVPATAKVFRTWGGTAVAAVVIGGAGSEAGSSKSAEMNAVRAAADILGNTPTVARASYVHPAAFEAGRTAAVSAAVDFAADRLASRDVRVLFVDPAVQSAVLAGLHEVADPA